MLNPVRAFEKRMYDPAKIDWDHLLFTDEDLKKLLLPLILQNLLTSFMGMADSMMVTRIGPAAISAVSLTDSINALIIQVFQAMATGGAIICSQYIGSGNRRGATAAAQQLILTIAVVSTLIMLPCIFLREAILRLIFGTVEPAVMENAMTYFLITALSFPAMAFFEGGAAFYRAGGNSRFPMEISAVCNALNIVGNSIFIFGMGMGVGGAALSTTLSRWLSAFVILFFLRLPRQEIVLRNYLSFRPNFRLIGRILSISIPSGIENGMFQFGKLAIQSSVSTLGTTAIAAQAMAIIFENLNGIAGIGIGIGLMTVAGQAIGAGRIEEAKYYIVRHMIFSWWAILLSCLAVFALSRPVMALAGMTPESADICFHLVIFITIAKPLIWVFSFIPPYGMRASGDVKTVMIVSSLSMWLCRVVLSTWLIRGLGIGPLGVWVGMACDWAVRGIIFMHRLLSMKWLQHKVI